MAKDTLLTSIKIRGRAWRSLTRRPDFLRISAGGLRRVTPGFILQAATHDPDSPRPISIGFTASRKVGNAVARNRAKRRLRALADRVMTEAADQAFDYVFIGRVETLNRNFAAMETDLRQALHRLAKGEGNPSRPRKTMAERQ